MSNNIWWAVTIQRVDGHPINGTFMTNDEGLIHTFARTVSPLPVMRTPYYSRRGCAKYVGRMARTHTLIEPESYRADFCQCDATLAVNE
jgi:hypothetical protein